MSDELLKAILEELRLSRRAGPEREIMSVSQAAEYLGQSEHTIREWVRMRKVPYFKVNGAIKFRKTKLDRWIDKCEVVVLE